MVEVGERVGAILCEDGDIVYFFGYGIYMGEEPIPEEKPTLNEWKKD